MPATQRYGRDHRVSLNHDVIGMVLYCLPQRKDVLSFMSTCHYWYSAGIPALLSHPVQLDSESSDITSFCDFVCFDLDRRAKSLRDICVAATLRYPGSIVQTDLTKLLLILRHATNLQKFGMISINNPSEAIISVLINHDNLTDLYLGLPDGATITALGKWRAPLKKVRLYLPRPSTDGFDQAGAGLYMDPTWILDSFNYTLREMVVGGAQTFSAGSIFPAMQELVLENATQTMPIDQIMEAFPNLKRLTISLKSGYQLSERGMESRRQRNYAWNAKSVWKSLDYLQGDLPCLYVLALPCRVHSLDVTIPPLEELEEPGFYNPYPMLTTLVDTLRPSQWRLRLTFIADPEGNVPLPACLTVAPTCITHLDLTHKVWGPSSDLRQFHVR